MFEYKIKIEKKVISILGPHLYGDTGSIIAELVSNCYDADAKNCWVTIKTGAIPEITIEDDGVGMTPQEVNDYFLDIGQDRRESRATSPGGRKVFGRKGIGKLAAFSLAKNIELYSLSKSQKAGCILDYDRITINDEDPITIPDEKIQFDPDRLSDKGTGTRIVLKNIQKNINTTFYYLVNRLIRNFDIDLEKFKIHMIKNNENPILIDYSNLDYFQDMDTIITFGNKFKTKMKAVKENSISDNYKKYYCYEDIFLVEKLPVLPKKISVMSKKGTMVDVDFNFTGWLGTMSDRPNLRKLVIHEGASPDEEKSISINDNRITIMSRDRIGEYDILPKVQTENIYDAYVVGEIFVDILEDDNLIDMAISNRRGYEETDERYKTLVEFLRRFVLFITRTKAEVNNKIKQDKEKQEADKIKEAFSQKTKTMSILKERLNDEERNTVADENLQFVRATRLGQNTKRILISHNNDNKEYGLFIVKIFEILGLDVPANFIFTSYPPTQVPHGLNVYDYLRDCFRDDLYVIFIFSRHFYDSNVCIAETGAAWATNKDYTNIIIDITYGDIDKPLDNAKIGFRISDLSTLNKQGVVQFVKVIYNHLQLPAPDHATIISAIDQSITLFTGRLNTDTFFPSRKHQGHPLCYKSSCGNTMDLKRTRGHIYYQCRTPGCKKRIKAKIE